MIEFLALKEPWKKNFYSSSECLLHDTSYMDFLVFAFIIFHCYFSRQPFPFWITFKFDVFSVE